MISSTDLREGRFHIMKAEFEKAASLTRNEREKTLLLERAELLAGTPPAPADP